MLTGQKVINGEWADYLKLPEVFTNSLGMKFVLIPPGEFLMGSTPEEIAEASSEYGPKESYFLDRVASEGPQHVATLTEPYYLGMYEVTQDEYQRIMQVNPSSFAATGSLSDRATVAGLNTLRFPVDTVSWNDAAQYSVKLSEKEGLGVAYVISPAGATPVSGAGYRLPTEASGNLLAAPAQPH